MLDVHADAHTEKLRHMEPCAPWDILRVRFMNAHALVPLLAHQGCQT